MSAKGISPQTALNVEGHEGNGKHEAEDAGLLHLTSSNRSSLDVSHEAKSDASPIWSPKDFLWDLWLFTESDFFTTACPASAFGIFGALAGSILLNNPDTPLGVLTRIPQVVLYNWSNLLIFAVANQRLPESVVEDGINKPHRPLPSGRMTTLGARRLQLISMPVVLAINFFLGTWVETALLSLLTWMYNDLGGGDEDFIVRNLLIGVAVGLYNAGSLDIAGGAGSSINEKGLMWSVIISCVIFTTITSQDLKDQLGDRTRRRRSAPIVLGDMVARHTISIPIAVWSVVCPWFWRTRLEGYALTLPLGAYIIWNLYNNKTFEGDRSSWRIWTFWTAMLYALPMVKQLT